MIGRSNGQMMGRGGTPEVVLAPAKWVFQQPSYTITKLSGDYWDASHTTVTQPTLNNTLRFSLTKVNSQEQEGSNVIFTFDRVLKRIRIFYQGNWSGYALNSYYVSVNEIKLGHEADSAQYIDVDNNSNVLQFQLFTAFNQPTTIAINILAIEEL